MGHEIKDAADMAAVSRYINDLGNIIQQGRWFDVDRLVYEIIDKYKTEANQYNKGRIPAKTPQERALACYNFLMSLRDEKAAKKATEKLAEEALKHLGGN